MRTPSYAATAKAMRKVARKYNRHGPLGVAVPGAYEKSEGWTGPVVRLDDLTDAKRMKKGGRARTDPAYFPTSVGILRCPFCDHWTGETAHLCGTCHIPLIPLSET